MFKWKHIVCPIGKYKLLHQLSFCSSQMTSISSRFSLNSQAFASEFKENLDDMSPECYMHSGLVTASKISVLYMRYSKG